MEPCWELPIRVPPRGRLRSLHQQLRTAIVDGRLKPGLRLPPTRAFSAAYGVSRNTAIAAYDLLLREGYLSTRRGAGTYVANVLPRPPERKPLQDHRALTALRLNALWHRPEPSAAQRPARDTLFDFRVGIPDIKSCPFDIWRRLSARAVRSFVRRPAAYDEPYGRPALREAIAQHVSFARAVACGADDIVVTAGAQQAFDLLARVLVKPNRTVVAVENPGYPPLRAAFEAAGAKIVAIPVDEEGLIIERIPSSTRVICVTPSHQFPLGVFMSRRRRAALLEFAHARGAVVVEDDYDGEFRYAKHALDALQTLDREQSVFYVGTFSKSLFPALRIGFIVAPPWARAALGAAKRCTDWHGATLTEETLAMFINEGHLARHVRRMRRVYGVRRQLLLSELHAKFSDRLHPIGSDAGLHLAALDDASLDMTAFVEKARRSGIAIASVRQFQSGELSGSGLVFGYGAIDECRIPEALTRLQGLWRQ